MTPELFLAAAKTSCPKSLVFRERQSTLGCCKLDDFLVLDARHPFRDREDVVPGTANADDDGDNDG